MEELIVFLASLRPTSLGPVALILLLGGAGAMAWPLLAARGGHSDLKRRLKVETEDPAAGAEPAPKKNVGAVREKAAKTAQEFYAKSDPENVARLRLKLIQAGYMDPRAVGMFFLIRFGGFVVGALGAFLVNNWMASAEATAMSRWSLVIIVGRGRLFPARARARPADLDQDARIPQRLSRFHGPDDRLLRRRHGHGSGHRARVEGTCDHLSRRSARTCSSSRWN